MTTKAGEVLKVMMGMGVMATLNDVIDQDTAMLVVEEMGHTPIASNEETVEDTLSRKILMMQSLLQGHQLLQSWAMLIMEKHHSLTIFESQK